MNPLVGALFVSIVIGAATGILAWRQRPEPGATPLAALMATQFWWSVCIVFRLQASTLAAKEHWMALAWIGVTLVPVSWTLFIFEYIGRDDLVKPHYIALLTVIPAITEILVLTSGSHTLLNVTHTTMNGVVVFQWSGIWYGVIAGYTYLLGILGAVALLTPITSDAITFRGQGALLLVGLVVPWATNLLYVAGVFPATGIDPTPIAFAVSGVAYLGAITRFSLLGTSPAPRRRAQRIVFNQMQEGAIVVDTNDNVVDVNDIVTDILDRSRSEILGTQASDVLPEYDDFPEEGPLSNHLIIENGEEEQPYDVTVTQISNTRGAPIGRIITFHDVGPYVRQQQRLGVLHRVLRHNIRTETNVIHGYAESFPDKDAAQIVKNRALQIDSIGEKGREAIELFDDSREDSRPIPLSELVDDCVEPLRKSNPHAAITQEPLPAAMVSSLFEPVFDNVLENAVVHNDTDTPNVTIRARQTGDHVEVRVIDNGPGISDAALDVLDAGAETALQHGNGLGLWIIKWGTEIAGGDVQFDANNPRGSRVTITAPILESKQTQ